MERPKVLAAIGVAGMVLAACGGGPQGGSQTIKGPIKIGVDMPTSGSDASDGLPTSKGAQLAVTKAGKVCGASSHTDACFTLQAMPLDDAVHGVHDPAQARKDAQQIV